MHRESHRELLRWCGPGTNGRLSAIIVPASRPAYNLVTALELAAALECTLVALTSVRAKASVVAGLAAEVPGVHCVAIDVPEDYRHEWLTFDATSAFPGADTHLGDLSLKRNLALLLGRLLGWQSVLLLDDDIRDVNPDLVRRAASGLSTYAAVGMLARDFPDNSVVCHANRLGGGRQDVFVSGSALALNPLRMDGFFPRIYNEDWFFLHDSIAERTVAATGRVRQLPYRPFANPQRALTEEFGDVLAEGLFSRLHLRGEESRPAAGYWDEFLVHRKQFIQRATERVALTTNEEDGKAAINALTTAEERRATLSGVMLENYVLAWRRDLSAWRRTLTRLPLLSSVDAAVELLDLSAISLPNRPSQDVAERLHLTSHHTSPTVATLNSPEDLDGPVEGSQTIAAGV